MPDETPTAIICDANVLIHYLEADRRILRMVVECIGPVYVPRPILDDEVEQMNVEEAEALGLTVLEPEDAFLIDAGNQGRSLSRNDRLIMVLARAKGYICWTSDSLLKRQCEEEGIKTRWGLEMMITLCQRGRLSGEEAIEVAQTIRKKDSSYITQEIVDEFERKLKIALLPGH